MFAKTYGAATLGVNGVLIDAEVDVSNGFPGFDVVGLLDTAVKESKERVRTAIKNSGVTLRQQKVTINLAPADIRKDSPGLDLPIAVGLLIAYGVLPQKAAEGSLFAAELSLEGELRGVRGILPMAVHARENGISRFFVARENANEALLVDGIEVYAVTNLAELIAVLSGRKQRPSARRIFPTWRGSFLRSGLWKSRRPAGTTYCWRAFPARAKRCWRGGFRRSFPP